MKVTKTFSFEAAHVLPLHDGKCSRLHGHNYVVEVTAEGPLHQEGPKTGMVIDFTDLKALVKEHIIEVCDHRNLNDLFEFQTTAENLALWMLQVLHTQESKITRVVVYETPDSCAEACSRDLIHFRRLLAMTADLAA